MIDNYIKLIEYSSLKKKFDDFFNKSFFSYQLKYESSHDKLMENPLLQGFKPDKGAQIMKKKAKRILLLKRNEEVNLYQTEQIHLPNVNKSSTPQKRKLFSILRVKERDIRKSMDIDHLDYKSVKENSIGVSVSKDSKEYNDTFTLSNNKAGSMRKIKLVSRGINTDNDNNDYNNDYNDYIKTCDNDYNDGDNINYCLTNNDDKIYEFDTRNTNTTNTQLNTQSPVKYQTITPIKDIKSITPIKPIKAIKAIEAQTKYKPVIKVAKKDKQELSNKLDSMYGILTDLNELNTRVNSFERVRKSSSIYKL